MTSAKWFVLTCLSAIFGIVLFGGIVIELHATRRIMSAGEGVLAITCAVLWAALTMRLSNKIDSPY